EREKLLKEEIARLQAQLRLREQQLFGRKPYPVDTSAPFGGSNTASRASFSPSRGAPLLCPPTPDLNGCSATFAARASVPGYPRGRGGKGCATPAAGAAGRRAGAPAACACPQQAAAHAGAWGGRGRPGHDTPPAFSFPGGPW